MFDLGMTELMVIGIVALIVVGPKDLPKLFQNVGRFVGRARGMAREFSRAMEDAADQSGVKDSMSDMQKAFKTASNPMGAAFDGVKQAAQDVKDSVDPTKFDPNSETGKLAAERAQSAKKIQAATARAAAERKAREAEEAMATAEKYEAELAEAKASEPIPEAEAKMSAPSKDDSTT